MYIQADAKFNRCREVTTEAVSECSKHKPDAQRARKERLFIGRNKSVSQFLYFAWKQWKWKTSYMHGLHGSHEGRKHNQKECLVNVELKIWFWLVDWFYFEPSQRFCAVPYWGRNSCTLWERERKSVLFGGSHNYFITVVVLQSSLCWQHADLFASILLNAGDGGFVIFFLAWWA